MNIITKGVAKISSALGVVAMTVCFVMMILMTADVVARYILKSSIPGTYELTENFLVIIVAFSFAITQMERRHIRVDVLTNIMPPKVRYIVDAICMIVSAAFIGMCAYAQILQTIAARESGIVSTVLNIKLWPFNFCLAVGVVIFFIVVCVHCINDILDLFRDGEVTEIAETETVMDTFN
jgi:TRAP-type C4-dicarboxylate transport system permease small subunit